MNPTSAMDSAPSGCCLGFAWVELRATGSLQVYLDACEAPVERFTRRSARRGSSTVDK
jgi:hypothetical protein